MFGLCSLLVIQLAWRAFAFEPADLIRFDDTFAGSGSFTSVAYGNGLFVAVGNQLEIGVGTRATIFSSSDGIDWTLRLAERTAGVLTGIVFGDGLFVAIGGTNAWTSPDGLTWARRNVGLRDGLSVVAYGKGLYLVGSGSGEIATSTDGFHWNPSPTRTEAGIQSIAYGNGRFVGLSYSHLLASTDGTNWVRTATVAPEDNYLTEVEYGNGLFIIVGLFGRLMTSPDGVGWTTRETGGDDRFVSVNYHDGEFVAVGYPGGYGLIVSISFDGLTWSRKTAIPKLGLAYPMKIVSGNGIFVAIGNINGLRFAALSTNAFDWRLVAPGYFSQNGFQSIAYGNGQFVAVDASGLILTSSDGRAWTARNSDDNSYLSTIGMAYGQGKFVGAGSRYYSIGERRGIGGLILTSTDAEVWTTFRLAERLNAIAYGYDQFVAVGPEGLILSSPDGLAWQRKNSGTTNWLTHTFYGDGAFIAVGHEGLILRSSDGSNWTRENSGTTNDLFTGVYGAGRFVVTGWQGTILTSPDGAQWRSQASSNTISKLAFGNETFVAVLGGGQILVSTNALSWTLKQAFMPGFGCCGLAFAYGQGKFILASGRIHYADVTQPLLSFGKSPGADLELLVAGAIGGVYQIEAAGDLTFPRWVPVGLTTNQEVATPFPEPNQNEGQRFYRARLVRYAPP